VALQYLLRISVSARRLPDLFLVLNVSGHILVWLPTRPDKPTVAVSSILSNNCQMRMEIRSDC
jgi:hypothetical protein